jgi:hypothetical protein
MGVIETYPREDPSVNSQPFQFPLGREIERKRNLALIMDVDGDNRTVYKQGAL